ncbi:CoA transferase [bacterium]|nr:CoA transferase [bacterium]
MDQKPLEGIRVLDMTHILAGPYCSLVLKNLGASVIKIERPELGDFARYIGPFLGENRDVSSYFLSVNAGKQSLSFDLKSDQGKEILSRLIKNSDVLVENFRPGTLAELGFSEDKISELNPQLVYAGVSGFGETGPMSNNPAFDMIIQALSGLISITGSESGETTRVGTSISDIMAGVFAAVGVLALLYRRGIINRGGRIDVAMLDSSVAILENAIARFQVDHKVPGPIGTRHPSITPFGAFKTADTEIIVAAGNDGLFKQLCEVIGRLELIEDDRFKDNYSRTNNAEALKKILDTVFSSESATTWLDRIEKAGIPCSRINKIDDLFEFDQIRARHMLVPISGIPDFQVAGNPVKIKNVQEDQEAGRFPELGEHNDQILADVLGYSDHEIEALYKEKVIFKRKRQTSNT